MTGLSNVFHVLDTPYEPKPLPIYDYSRARGQSEVAICIDNGTHSIRAGFSNAAAPHIARQSQITKYRDRKSNKQVTLFGEDVDLDAQARANVKSMWDGEALINGEVLESTLDYAFLQLGIDTDSIQHPVIMSEKLANPLYCRALTSEVVFELYQPPSLTFGIDSLFAFNTQQKRDGLVVNMGHTSTTLIPVLDGRSDLARAKRIPWGGSQASELMLKLAQLKYPSFPTRVTQQQATFLYRETARFASDYDAELAELCDPVKMGAFTKVAQFPYILPDVVEKTEEEVQALIEKRKESGRRLQEAQAKQRAEKLAIKLAELEDWKVLQAQRPKMKKAEFQLRVSEMTPFETEAELDTNIKRTEAELRKKQRKDLGEEAEPEEEPDFPLVGRPDEELTEEEIKEKRRQRLMKAGYDARVRARKEKAEEKERLAEVQRVDDQSRLDNLDAWCAKLRAEQESIISRIKDRERTKAQLADRKSSAAQNRMKSIAALASEAPTKGGKKRKAGEAEADDGFGRSDADWAVYRELGGEDESEEEEDDAALLDVVEKRLLEFDPTFKQSDTKAGRAVKQDATILSFIRGGRPDYDPESVDQAYQLHLNVERLRVPETWFQPSMVGLDSAGLSEIAGWIVNGYGEAERRRIMNCIYVTGGSSSIPNILPRLHNSLTPLLPFQVPLNVVGAPSGYDPRNEAWRGMAAWASTPDAKQARVTKAEYEENGWEYLKEHRWGNVAV